MGQMLLFEENEQLNPGNTDEIEAMKAAGKVQTEIHRLMGLLRFSPGPDGTYIARCAPDYFILPALAEHFTLRFGETPWVIIDEKRNICLCKETGNPARLIDLPVSLMAGENKHEDAWEDLWRLYHKSINNEARNNTRLQRQFMPERYQKYLCELNQKS
jgi:probable DNA metabolism protein